MTKEQKDDFPLPVALLVLALVVGFFVLGEPLLSGDLPWPPIEAFLKRNEIALIVSALLFIFNITTIAGGLQRWIGFRKQGSRLKTISGNRSLFNRDLFFRLGVGVLAASVTFMILHHFKLGGLR